jgi:hypothetical protein
MHTTRATRIPCTARNHLAQQALAIQHYKWMDLPIVLGPRDSPYYLDRDYDFLRIPFNFDPQRVIELVKIHGMPMRDRVQVRMLAAAQVQQSIRNIRNTGVKNVIVDPPLLMHPLLLPALQRLEVFCTDLPRIPMNKGQTAAGAGAGTTTTCTSITTTESNAQQQNNTIPLLAEWIIVVHRNVASTEWLELPAAPQYVAAPPLSIEGDTKSIFDTDATSTAQDNNAIGTDTDTTNGDTANVDATTTAFLRAVQSEDAAPNCSTASTTSDGKEPWGYLFDQEHGRIYIPADFTESELRQLLRSKHRQIARRIHRKQGFSDRIRMIQNKWQLRAGIRMHPSIRRSPASVVESGLRRLQLCVDKFFTAQPPPPRWNGISLVKRTVFTRETRATLRRLAAMVEKGDMAGMLRELNSEHELVKNGFPSKLQTTSAEFPGLLAIPIDFTVSEFLVLIMQ